MKQRILSIFLALLVLVGTFVFAAPTHAESFDSGMITGEKVAFRSGASKDSGLIRRFSYGTIVEVLDTNVNAEWHRVRYQDKEGYVNRMYVSLDPSLNAYKLTCMGEVVNVKATVNVRAKADSSSKLLGTADRGAMLEVTEANHTAGWHQVRYNGQTAYVSADYLKLSPNASDSQLSSLTVEGGTMSPAFSPAEYGYVVRTDSDSVTVCAEANDGVRVSVDGTGKNSVTVSMPHSGSKTVRISVDGKVRYSVYIVRGALIVGTWNIKRGNGHLELQARLIENQQPDIVALQEVLRNNGGSSRVDNLASLKTKNMQNVSFGQALKTGGGYGVGLLSKYAMSDLTVTKLPSGNYEQRILQHVVITVDGKQVSLYNTHLTYNSTAVRKKQFNEIVKAMDADPNEYKILFGDFNAKASEFSVFDDGYTVINTPNTKYLDYSGSTIRKNVIDNIIVSDNITVLNSRMIPNSYSDHKPLFAYIVLD